MQHLQPNTSLQGGKYRIERVLGQGGFGITYLARNTAFDVNVAIKELFIGGSGQAVNGRSGNNVTVTNVVNQVLFDKHKEKFKKEASRLATLRHKNLVRVYEWFEENGTVYYVMDFIEGESLRDKLNREGALSESLVMNYLQQLLSALQVVHEKDIWHLDIKPENIMVDSNNHVYLIDFGASKHIEQSNGTLTTSSMLAYTPGYFPPEQSAVTMKNIGAWTDIYALGATLYNLLTRRNPPTFDDIISEGRKAFSFPSNISSQTQNLIVQMMKVNRNERPQSVSAIRNKQITEPKEESENTIIESNRRCNTCGYVFSPTDNRSYCPICHSAMTKDNDRNTPKEESDNNQYANEIEHANDQLKKGCLSYIVTAIISLAILFFLYNLPADNWVHNKSFFDKEIWVVLWAGGSLLTYFIARKVFGYDD